MGFLSYSDCVDTVNYISNILYISILIIIELSPSSLTSEVSVKVVQPAHLQLQLIPHGFLQGFPLGGGFGKVFVSLWHQLNLCFQLLTSKREKKLNYFEDWRKPMHQIFIIILHTVLFLLNSHIDILCYYLYVESIFIDHKSYSAV